MDFALSPKAKEISERMWDFMRKRVFPAEQVYRRTTSPTASTDPHTTAAPSSSSALQP